MTRRTAVIVWSDDTIALLRRRASEGYTASQFARELSRDFPGVTRNALIGKASREGIAWSRRPLVPRVRLPVKKVIRETASRSSTSSDGAVESQKRKVRARGTAMQEASTSGRLAPRPSEPIIDPFIGITFAEIRDGLCRWPQDEPNNLDEFRFCGAPTPERSYCAFHNIVSVKGYGPKEPRRQWIATTA